MPVFFEPVRDFTVGEIAELTGAEALQPAGRDRRIANIAPLDTAGPGDISFCDNARYREQFVATRAGACLVSPAFAKEAPERLVLLRTAEPYRAFVAVAQALFPGALRPASLFATSGIGEGARVHSEARLEGGVTVDPGALIGPRAEIGAGSLIGPAAVIGPGVRIGRDCAVGAGATVTNAVIGDRVIVHPGARIGQDGFGYLPGARGHGKIPQIGRVIIQDDVEIGANTTIDRGSSRDTMIGEGTKIDNLVQIAHNVSIGRHCLIASQTGISGSVTVEDFVMMGGQVGIADHLTIGARAQIAAASGVMSDIPARGRWGGTPAQPARLWLKGEAALRRLARGRREGGEA